MNNLDFRNACTLVRVGNLAPVQAILTQPDVLYTPLEQAYLRAWMACSQANAPDLSEEEQAAGIILAAMDDLRHAAIPGIEPY